MHFYRALAQIQELQTAEKHYSRCIQVGNDTKRVYGSQMKVILKSLEDMDLKRLACFKDALRKLMVYQTSGLRNVQYDLDLTIKVTKGGGEDQGDVIVGWIIRCLITT